MPRPIPSPRTQRGFSIFFLAIALFGAVAYVAAYPDERHARFWDFVAGMLTMGALSLASSMWPKLQRDARA
ncbi:MAG TPA: hypothetical protein VKE69_06680 [Planctomycetota bacterium]|nr:hypothetical protein [Planctomycetota bacterium]